jgi:heme oxygenase
LLNHLSISFLNSHYRWSILKYFSFFQSNCNFLVFLDQLDELRGQDAKEKDQYKNEMDDLRLKCEERKQKVDEERNRFMEFKKQVALNAVSNRSGKPLPPKVGHMFRNYYVYI